MEATAATAAKATGCAAAAISTSYATTCVSTSNAAAAISTSYAATRISASCAAGITAISTRRIASARISISAAISVAAAEPIAGMSVEAPTVPRANADEEAAGEPVRTVIAIRRASVWIIRVVAPLAVRRAIIARRIHNGRTNTHANRDLGIRCRY